ARRIALAQRPRASLDPDCRQAGPERTALRPGADHRHGHRRLHAARRRGVLRLLCDHARRYRGSVARHAALPRHGARRLADCCVRAVVHVVSAALFRLSWLTLSGSTGTALKEVLWTAEGF